MPGPTLLKFIPLLLVFLLLLGFPGQVAVPGENSDTISSTLPSELVVSEPLLSFDNGSVYVVGEVLNQGLSARRMVRIEVKFHNEAGEVVTREGVYLNRLNPGERKAYRVQTWEEEPIGGVDVRVDGGFPTEARELPLKVEGLSVTSSSGDFLRISGHIKNQGRIKIGLVKLQVNFRGEEGELLHTTGFFLTDLEPGKARPFAWLSQVREGWTEYEIQFD